MGNSELVVMICRSSDEPLSPGSTPGFQCAACSRRLQVSPAGLKRLKETRDCRLLCNECGVAYAEFAKHLGKLEPLMQVHPAAQAQLDRNLDTPVARWLREQMKEKSE